jgi:hypothetical protein
MGHLLGNLDVAIGQSLELLVALNVRLDGG